MELFLDSANKQEIEDLASIGILSGLTTNPSLIAKESNDVLGDIAYFCELVNGPVSVEAMAKERKAMIAEARKIAKIHPQVTVKLPITMEALAAVKVLSTAGIKTNVTLVFSANQALLAARAGATFVSPFIGRMEDAGMDGLALIGEIKAVFAAAGLSTKIIAASIRDPYQVTKAAMLGCDIATIPYTIFKKMVGHPLTDQGIEKFDADWAKRPTSC